MTIQELIEATEPNYWQHKKYNVFRRTVMTCLISAADSNEQSLSAAQEDLSGQEGAEEHISNKTITLNFSQRDRAITQIAKTYFTKSRNRLTQQETDRIFAVIQRANESDYFSCPAKIRSFKDVRPNLLASNINQFVKERLAARLLPALITALAKPQSALDHALKIYYQLIVLGYGLEPAASILLHLRHGDLGLPTLCTPVHPEETGPYFHHRVLPEYIVASMSLWSRANNKEYLKRCRGRNRDKAYALPIAGLDDENRRSIDSLTELVEILNKRHRELINDISESLGRTTISTFTTLKSFTTSARKTALTALTLQPAMFKRLASLPFPADSSNGLGDWLKDTQYHLTAFQRIIISDNAAPLYKANTVNSITELSDITLPASDDSQWLADDELRYYLSNSPTAIVHCTKEWRRFFGESYLTQSQVEAFKTLSNDQATALQKRWGDTSGATLALKWLANRALQLGTVQSKLSTVGSDARRIISGTLLEFEESHDMSEWEDENTAELLERLERTSTNTTRQLQIGALEFLKYCQAQKVLPEHVSLPSAPNKYFSYSRRNTFLTEDDLHTLRNKLTIEHPESASLLLLMHALPFYLGVRISELLNRTFNDIHLCEGTGFLLIPWGKSRAARRKIHLEHFLPEWVIGLLEDYLKQRLATFDKRRKDFNRTALFGPPENHNPYSRKALLETVIAVGKYYCRKDIDLHSHRHRFASVYLLGVAAETDPSETFNQPIPTWPFDELALDSGTMYEVVKKHIGHAELSTTIENYCHSFGTILSLGYIARKSTSL